MKTIKKNKNICVMILSFLLSFSVIFPLLGSKVNAEEFITPQQSGKGYWDYNYTGDVQFFKVPEDGYYGFELYGGQGGNKGSYQGGKGGYIKTVIKLNKGDVLYINVGGGSGNTFNGGGKGSDSNGGGATDIRLNSNLIKDRIFVAGGGGGASSNENGGAGGETNINNLVVNPSKGKPEVLSTPHVHLGNEVIGGECYRIPIYHKHKGDEISGGACYTKPVYHVHETLGKISTPLSEQEYIYDDGSIHSGNMSSVEGGCYNTPVYLYHHHTGSPLSGGGCYTRPIYHVHTPNCYSQVSTTCSCTAYAGKWYQVPGETNFYLRCEVCGHGGHGPGGSCGATTTTPTLTCGKSTDITGFNLGCGKSEGQLLDTKYTLDCYKSTDTVIGYELTCPKTSTTIDGYKLSCDKEFDNGVFEGQSGLYGGGGGYYGGKAGYLIYHHHSGACPSHYDPGYEGCQCGSCYCRDSDHAIPYYICQGCGHGHHQSYVGACSYGKRSPSTTYLCGKTPGVSIDARASAKGGSSYNISGSDLIDSKAGIREGNGFCKITNVYGITYALNKGKNGNSAPNYIWYGEEGTIDNPVREGYTFQGWDIENLEPVCLMDGKEIKTKSVTRVKYTKYKNLRYNPGYVKFTAIWKDDIKPEFSNIVYENKTVTDYNGKSYTPGTWTGQNVVATATVKDAGSGVHSLQWNGKKYSNADKAQSFSDIDEWILNTTANPNLFTNSKEFSITGLYNGLIYAKDNADTENTDHISNGKPNVTTISYGDIRIDQTKPEGSITYLINGEWTTHGETWTNKPVTVKISTKDIHSGLHATAVSWDHQQTWVKIDNNSSTSVNDVGNNVDGYATKIFKKNVTDVVYIRDAVGNIKVFPYEVSGIDIKPPTVWPEYKPKEDDVPNEPLPKDPNNQQKYDYPNDKKYSYNNTGSLTYDWINTDLNISFKSKDEEHEESGYSVSQVKEMRIYQADKNFKKISLIKKNNTASISHTCTDQGIIYFIIEAEDYATNVTTVNLTVKIDKTAPVIDQSGHSSDFYIEDIDLNKYGIDEVESKIKDSAAMKRKFRFKTSDYNDSVNGATKDPSDSSGICKFTMKLFNMDDLSDYKEYDLSQYLSGTAKNTKEFSSSSGIKAILEAVFGTDINTFAEFPNAAALNYELTIEDRAGNKTVYKNSRGNEIKNFSIKAVIYYADVHEEEVLSSEYADYDSSYTQLNSSDTDSNGKVTNVPYFRTGDFGYVEAWTIGYVPKIQFDFSDVGLVTANNIHDNKLDELYNLGITSNIFYDRQISYVNGEKIDVSVPDNNGIPYACHYGGKEKASSNGKEIEKFKNYFEENGTSIRISPYYILEKDNTNKKDGTSNYKWEVHNANIIALKGSGAHSAKSYPSYVLWDTGSFDVHHRVTHES